MVSQDNEKEKLDKRIDELFSERMVYGNLKKPETLLKLIKLVKDRNHNTDRGLGFLLWEGTKPDFPAPIDNIPFAWTGGDGCYFGFLTDFGRNSNLENAPVIFVSPTDLSKKHPHHGVKLFARNIKDFLTIMTQVWFSEIVRFKDVTVMDFEGEIKKVKDEFNEYATKEVKLERQRLIDDLVEYFELNTISNLNEYYRDFYADRKKQNLIDTMDGLGISTEAKPEITFKAILEPIEVKSLESKLNEITLDERKKFYRDAGWYLYPHYDENFNDILKIIGKFLAKDGFNREANIVNTGIEIAKDYKKYMIKNKNKTNER